MRTNFDLCFLHYAKFLLSQKLDYIVLSSLLGEHVSRRGMFLKAQEKKKLAEPVMTLNLLSNNLIKSKLEANTGNRCAKSKKTRATKARGFFDQNHNKNVNVKIQLAVGLVVLVSFRTNEEGYPLEISTTHTDQYLFESMIYTILSQ